MGLEDFADDDGFGFDLGPLLDLSPEAQQMAEEMVAKMRTPLAPGDSRRHHFVPKFFLRRFSAGEQLMRLSLDDPSKPTPAGVNDLAVAKDLYTVVDEEVGPTVSIERMLAVLDGEASTAVARLAYAVLFPPQTRDRFTLGLWLSMLHLRGPSMRRALETLADQAMKLELSLIHDADTARAKLRKEGHPEPDDAEVQALLDAARSMDEWEIAPHQNELIRTMLRMSLEAAPFFLQRYWSVVKFSEPGLIVTDRPIVLYQDPQHARWAGVGLATADEIWVPLDRSTALILHSDPQLGEVVFRNDDAAAVDEFNQAVLWHAHHEAYCHPDDVQRVLALEFPPPDRPILSSSGADWIDGFVDGINEPPRRRKHHRYRPESSGQAGGWLEFPRSRSGHKRPRTGPDEER